MTMHDNELTVSEEIAIISGIRRMRRSTVQHQRKERLCARNGNDGFWLKRNRTARSAYRKLIRML